MLRSDFFSYYPPRVYTCTQYVYIPKVILAVSGCHKSEMRLERGQGILGVSSKSMEIGAVSVAAGLQPELGYGPRQGATDKRPSINR